MLGAINSDTTFLSFSTRVEGFDHGVGINNELCKNVYLIIFNYTKTDIEIKII